MDYEQINKENIEKINKLQKEIINIKEIYEKHLKDHQKDLSKEEKGKIKYTISSYNASIKQLKKLIKSMENKKPENYYIKNSDKFKINNKEIKKIDGTINKLEKTSINQELLAKRIKYLKNKKGKIERKQHKIISKYVENKLKGIKKISNYKKINYMLINESIKQEEKIPQKLQDELTKKINFEKTKELIKESGNDINSILLNGKYTIKSKLSNAKIKMLNTKKGCIEKIEKQIIAKNVGKKLISNMKQSISKFNNSIIQGFKAFRNTFSEEMNNKANSKSR